MSGSPKVTPLRSRLREASEARPPGGGGHLPDDCPVTPIGVEGALCWYIDGVGQLIGVERKAHSKLAIHGLFSPHTTYLLKAKAEWAKTVKQVVINDETGQPTIGMDGKPLTRDVVVDFRPDTVARDLMAACAELGPFQPVGRVRGRGVWLGDDDDLVPHHGTGIVFKNAVVRPGRHGKYVYPRGPERTPPARDAQPGGAEGPAARVLTDLGCWNWSRPGLDQKLMLGWICASFYAGALEWRPHGWVNGPRAAGKSTLFRYLARLLHEPSGCIMTGNTTAAGVRSVLKDDALPALFDDAEAGETPDRIRNLVELMRAASSGSLVLRGTAEHGSASFTVRFTGLVNSILRPPLTAQDLSRLMLVQLLPLDRDARAPVMAASDLSILGQQLFRRMLDAWPRFRAELPRWISALKGAGMPGRAPEQFGVLLAAQDVALSDIPADSDTMAQLAMECAEGTASDRAEEMAEWQRCLERITSTVVPAFRGGQQINLGTLIAMVAMQRVWQEEADPDTGKAGGLTVAPVAEQIAASRVLANYGLRVVLDTDRGMPLRRHLRDLDMPPSTAGDGRAVGWLAVANGHVALNQTVFARSHYAAASGTSGGWKAALETAPDVKKGKEMRFGGAASRCVLVPLDLVLDGGHAFGEVIE